jgi:hypothetical protein
VVQGPRRQRPVRNPARLSGPGREEYRQAIAPPQTRPELPSQGRRSGTVSSPALPWRSPSVPCSRSDPSATDMLSRRYGPLSTFASQRSLSDQGPLAFPQVYPGLLHKGFGEKPQELKPYLCDRLKVLQTTEGFRVWAMLGSNQRLLPCEGESTRSPRSTVVCKGP